MVKVAHVVNNGKTIELSLEMGVCIPMDYVLELFLKGGERC